MLNAAHAHVEATLCAWRAPRERIARLRMKREALDHEQLQQAIQAQPLAETTLDVDQPREAVRG